MSPTRRRMAEKMSAPPMRFQSEWHSGKVADLAFCLVRPTLRVMGEGRLSLDDVRHVAKLSRLALSEEQLRKLGPQLESILEYVAKIGRAEVAGVEPTAHATPLHNVLREDVAGEPMPLEKTLRNAPEVDGPFFKVPKVIGGEEDSAG